MAERRMFAKTIIDSDAFLDMPMSTQALYFHLSMRADDDGFINNPKKIQRMIGASEDDLRLLIAKSFLITFDSGVVVIKHWRIHNYIQSDRYKPTVYTEEKAMLGLKSNKAYTLDTECIHDVSKPETQVRLGKDSIGKLSKDNTSKEVFVEQDSTNTEQIKEIISYLNEKAGKNFSWKGTATKRLINARLNEKYSVDDFKKVIDNKVAEWKDDAKMSKYLQPSTLFAPSHFDEYLNQDIQGKGSYDYKKLNDEMENW